MLYHYFGLENYMNFIMNTKVDDYIENLETWKDETVLLRHMLLECDLVEEFKWRQPCYTYNKANIVILSNLKDASVLSFLKGVLLSDEKSLLIKPGENSQSARYLKFTSPEEITNLKGVIQSYIYEAIELERAGVKVDFIEKSALTYPEELKEKWLVNPEFKAAFEKLTPGRKRGYNLYFTAPKQSKTRTSRIEKYIPKILMGKGIHDCTCGHSKRMPTCDGSHKYIS